jgi:hypothetical protein
MTELNQLAQKMLDLDEDTLKAQLGIRIQEMEKDITARSASLESLDEDLNMASRGLSLDSAAFKFGDEFFKRLNVKSYDLMCGELFDDVELKTKFLDALKEGSDKGVTVLAPILVAQLGMGYSIAMFVAVLIIKTLYSSIDAIASATSDTICETWKNKMPNANKLPEEAKNSAQQANLGIQALN